MRHPDPASVPAVPPAPEGYVVRPLGLADAESLAVVLAESFQDPGWTAQRTASTILQGDDVLQTWGVVWRAGAEVAATASCQLLPARFVNAGVVHMVGALAAHAGKGLGGLVTHAVMARFARMGYPAIYLTTDDFRLAAIRTYLKLGFVPDLQDEDHGERWAAVGKALGLDLPR